MQVASVELRTETRCVGELLLDNLCVVPCGRGAQDMCVFSFHFNWGTWTIPLFQLAMSQLCYESRELARKSSHCFGLVEELGWAVGSHSLKDLAIPLAQSSSWSWCLPFFAGRETFLMNG